MVLTSSPFFPTDSHSFFHSFILLTLSPTLDANFFCHGALEREVGWVGRKIRRLWRCRCKNRCRDRGNASKTKVHPLQLSLFLRLSNAVNWCKIGCSLYSSYPSSVQLTPYLIPSLLSSCQLAFFSSSVCSHILLGYHWLYVGEMDDTETCCFSLLLCLALQGEGGLGEKSGPLHLLCVSPPRAWHCPSSSSYSYHSLSLSHPLVFL